MPIFRIVEVILPIIFIALIGFVFGKFKNLNLKTLADFIIYISAPALALTLLSRQRMDISEISVIILAALAVIILSGALSYLIFKVLKIQVPAGLFLPIMFMNSGFIGYPLALFAMGEMGFSRAIVYDMTNAIIIFTLGIYIASRGKDRFQAVKMPFIYAASIGIILAVFSIRIPQIVYIPLYLLGSTTIPIALFLLGSQLAAIKMSAWKLPAAAAILRFILGLGLGLAIVFVFRLQGLAAKIIILSSCLPSAITTSVIAQEYDSDASLVASTIALSTLIGLITIPFVLSVFIIN